jgi:4'-phosphopantetheinyl transferase
MSTVYDDRPSSCATAPEGCSTHRLQRAWPDGPSLPLLAAQTVHLWRADLAEVLRLGGGARTLATALCAEERTRAEAITDSERRALWTAARALLRTLLSGYLRTPPASLRIVSGAHGKPHLDPRAHPPLSFNLSHSGPLALYAFARSTPLGVDVERAGRRRDHAAIVRRVLGEAPALRLEGLAPPAREREFLRAWTRHEAALKLRGTGFARDRSATSGGRPVPRKDANPPTGATGSTAWIAELAPAPGAAGALAVALAPEQLRCWSWSGRPALVPATGR